MVTSETINSDGKVYYSKLNKKIVRVLNIFDSNGNAFDYETHHQFLTAPTGTLTIEYEYVPDDYGIDDVVDYSEKQVPLRVIAYGLVAEILLCEYSFEQAVMCHKRYVDGLEDKFLPKNAMVKKRSWL